MEETKKTTETEKNDITPEAFQEKMRGELEKAERGKIVLFKPMICKDQEVKEIHYDFSKTTSNDLVDSLDKSRAPSAAGSMNAEQAQALFLSNINKVEHSVSGLDAHDVAQQASVQDMLMMIRVAQNFFARSYAAMLMSIQKW